MRNMNNRRNDGGGFRSRNDGGGFRGGGGGGFRNRNNNFQREMHKAICSTCKKECEVPFKPKEDRPVYCRECFAQQKDSE